MDIPEQWRALDLQSLRGLLMVVGGPDVGKSTFAHYLWQKLAEHHQGIGFLDGDPGQSRLGPPTTISLVMGKPIDSLEGETYRVKRAFVGSVSPSGHMVQMLLACSKLIKAAKEAGITTLIYDTTGLIHKEQGGVLLKQTKIELFSPSTIFAIQRGGELEHILAPFRRSKRFRVIDLKPSLATKQRSTYERRGHRRAQFAKYFEVAHTVSLDWSTLGVFPRPYFTRTALVALEDSCGLTLALGITTEVFPRDRQVRLLVPQVQLDKLVAMRIGDMGLDPQSFEDHRL